MRRAVSFTMTLLVITSLLISLTSICWAADEGRWTVVHTNDDYTHSIDKSSIRTMKINNIKDPVIDCWIKIDFNSEESKQNAIKQRESRKLPIDKYIGTDFYFVVHYRFNPAERQFLMLETFEYNVSGKLIGKGHFEEKWQPVVAGTIVEASYDEIIKYVKENAGEVATRF